MFGLTIELSNLEKSVSQMIKKIINTLIVLMLINSALGLQDVKATPDVQYIYSINDFNQIVNNLSGHYRLMNDLDFNKLKQLPIGTKDKPFTGVFDGNGFSISNYEIERNESTTHIGLFGHAKNATFRNLYIRDTAIEFVSDINEKLFGGILLGQGESVRLENIQITSSVSISINPLFKSTVGGIVGELTGSSVKPSYLTVISNEGSVSGKGEVGGIVGSANYTELESVKNTGTITSDNSAGGIVGYLYRGKLNQAENAGEIQSTSRGGGGVGSASYSVIENVINHGFIRSNGSWGDFGGIIGHMINTTLSSAKNVGGFETRGNLTYVGGLVGEAGQGSVIRRGANQSAIEVQGYVGGIVGTASQTLVEQTYNEGNLSATTSAGISSSISNVVIRDSFNWGKINGQVTAGGIVAYAYQNSKIETSYNSGYVKAYTSGALAGYYNGTMFGAYGITQSKLIGSGDNQGTNISPFETIDQASMTELSSSNWDFVTTSYPILKNVERPIGNQQHPIVIKQIDLMKTDYLQYEEVDVSNGTAELKTNIGTTIISPLDKSMIQYEKTLERSGKQFVNFLISGLSANAEVNVTARYRAIFMNHQNVQADVQFIEPGQKANPIILPPREGYTLQGWTPEFVTMNRDQIYKPIYVKNDYWIRVMDGETQIEGVSVSHGERLSQVIPAPKKSNYLFVAFFEDKDLKKKADLNQIATKSIDLFAKFVPVPTVIDINTTSNGGRVTVKWKGINNPSRYNIEVSNTSDFTNFTRYETSEEQYELYLDPKTTHFIRVVPILTIDEQGWEGQPASVIQPILLKPLDHIVISTVTSSSVNLSWNRQNYDEFYVYRSENQAPFIRIGTVKSSTWTDTNLDYRKNYRYNIVGHLKIDETSGLLSDTSETVTVRLKLPYTKPWEVNEVSENSTTVMGRTSTRSGYVEVYKGSQRIGKKTTVYNGSYRVTIPKQLSGTKLTVKFYPHSMYDMVTKEIIVKKNFSTLTVNAPVVTNPILTGKGKPGATVRAYVGTTPISKPIKIGSNGIFKMTMPPQRGGQEIKIVMSQSGYIDRTIKVKVINVFTTFKIGTVKSTQTYIAENGHRGAKVQAFVGTRSISKVFTVNSKGVYRLVIPKQKTGTIIKLRMTQSGYKTLEKSIRVLR